MNKAKLPRVKHQNSYGMAVHDSYIISWYKRT